MLQVAQLVMYFTCKTVTPFGNDSSSSAEAYFVEPSMKRNPTTTPKQIVFRSVI